VSRPRSQPPKRALLVDIDGVLVVSWEALPGAVDALRRVRAAGVPVRFLTNTTSRTRLEITQLLRDAGFEVADDEVVTVLSAASAFLAREHPGARCLLLNSGDVAGELPDVHLVGEETPPGDVDVVVLGGAGPEFTYAALNHALACVLEGAALVALHRNVLWRTSTGLQLDTGAFLLGLERAADVEATVVGKPAPAMFEAALESIGVTAGEAAMVGDDLDSDVRAAQHLGIAGVQVRTGKFRAGQLESGEPPDVVLDSFGDVPDWLDL
jgi:HAD superfamily hydrolase (TIGR01458 family)